MMGMWGMLVVWLFWIVLLAIAGWLVYRLFQNRQVSPGPGGASPRESPTEILERRYAAGEISTEEYEERKSKLRE